MVYIVDSDDAIGEALTALLETYAIRVRSYGDAKEFLDAYAPNESEAGCLLVETNLPGSSGLSLLRELRKQGSKLPVILLANTVNADIRREALKAGAVDVIEKPLVNAFLLGRLSQVLSDTDDLVPRAPRGTLFTNGERITFRVMQPEDANIEQAFVQGLSDSSKHLRFFMHVELLSPKMLQQFTHHSYPDSYAIIATVIQDEKEVQIGVARYAHTETAGTAEFAIVVADKWQGRGIATRLLGGITTAATVAGIIHLEGLVLRNNHSMLILARKLGFVVGEYPDDSTVLRVVKHIGKYMPDQKPEPMPDVN